MGYIDLPTFGRAYYETLGKGQCILLIHGAAQDTLSWRFVLPELENAGYEVFAVDLPGHGKSQLFGGRTVDDLAVYADFIIEFIEVLGLRKPTIVGHSMAGGIGLHVALKSGHLVRHIVLVDGAGFTNGTYNDEFFELVMLNATDWFEVNFRTICSPHTAQDRVDEIAFDVLRCAPSVAWCDIKAYSQLDLSNRLDNLDVPVTFLHGEDDWSITPEMARRTAEMCINTESRVVILPGTGHFPHTEAPQTFAPILLAALAYREARDGQGGLG